MACLYCRQRKRRCDGAKPTCGLCRERNITCVSTDKDPVSRRPSRPTSGSDLGAHSIRAIQDLLQSHTDTLRSLQRSIGPHGAGSPDSDSLNHASPVSNATTLGAATAQDELSTCTQAPRQAPPQPDTTSRPSPLSRGCLSWPETPTKSPYMREENPEFPPLTIPPGHEASSSSLLNLPQVQALVGEFPHEFFYRVEARHSQALDLHVDSSYHHQGGPNNRHEATHDHPSALPRIRRETTDALVELFWEEVHIFHPLFQQQAFYDCYKEAISHGLKQDAMSAVLLLTFALGALMRDNPRGRSCPPQHGCEDEEKNLLPSLYYFKTAQRMLMALWTQSVGCNLVLSQGLFLCALYLIYLPQPLLSMKYVHLASTSVEQCLIRSQNLKPPQSRVEEIVRLSWSCFVVECNLLAEFHQPRSGIQFLADRMLFPSCGSPPSASSMYFLAEISARSLGNRIHYSINFTDSINAYMYTGGISGSPQRPAATAANDMMDVDNLASLQNVCNELDRQVETWYKSLPDAIKPNLMPGGPDNDNIQAALLQCRYWSLRNKIYRPFVFKATSMPAQVELTRDLSEKCQACITACRRFLECVGGLLDHRSPYLYTASHGAFASVLMLSLSALSPSLNQYVSDLDSLQTLALDALRPWADSGSGIESAYEILNAMRSKFRYRDHFDKSGMQTPTQET